jgi:hypothetical protein
MIPVMPKFEHDSLKSLSSDDDVAADDIFQSSEASPAPALSLPVFSQFYATAVFGHTAPAATAATAVAPPFADVGPLTVNVAAQAPGHLSFTLDFATAIPSAAQEDEVINAAKLLSTDIKENVNIDLQINFSGKGGGANAGPTGSFYYSYATVRAAMIANEPGDANLSSLPLTLPDPANNNPNQMIWVPNAEAKALGIVGTNTLPADDGVVNFAIDIDDNALEGVALHEITHSMGRVPMGPPDEADDAPGIFDLFRYTTATPHTIYVDDAIPAAAAYFSVDGGTTNLANYGMTSDPSDYLNEPQNANDPFNEFYTAGQTVQGLTQLDLTQLDVLGFNTSGATPSPCYVTGTDIRTDQGDVPVERLRVGDRVVTASGQLRPIVWIGHRKIDISRYPDPAAVRPVRVSKGAFGQGLPRRDLWLSPGHSVVCANALIPISCLINGRSVAQISKDSVEYWHVELDAHDVILAEMLPAESYLDCGNRTAFANGGAFVEAHPDFEPKHWAATCLPLLRQGPEVVATRARLLAVLADEGDCVDQEADAHIVVDGRRIEPTHRSETQLAFALPAGGREIELRSNVFIPAHTVADSADPRELGLCVSGVEIDGTALALDDDEACGSGWHEAEYVDGRGSHRWTNGATPLSPGARNVVINLAGVGYYWRARDERPMALSA